jgi:hypothetical protein
VRVEPFLVVVHRPNVLGPRANGPAWPRPELVRGWKVPAGRGDNRRASSGSLGRSRRPRGEEIAEL